MINVYRRSFSNLYTPIKNKLRVNLPVKMKKYEIKLWAKYKLCNLIIFTTYGS